MPTWLVATKLSRFPPPPYQGGGVVLKGDKLFHHPQPLLVKEGRKKRKHEIGNNGLPTYVSYLSPITPYKL